MTKGSACLGEEKQSKIKKRAHRTGTSFQSPNIAQLSVAILKGKKEEREG